MATELFYLKLKAKKTVSIRVHPCQKKFNLLTVAKWQSGRGQKNRGIFLVVSKIFPIFALTNIFFTNPKTKIMNKTFRKLGGAFLFFAALSMTSCDIVGVPDNASGKFVVKINTEDMVLAPGETASRPSTNATATTTYTSSDPAVATVDNAGRVTAVAEGTCVITVSTPFLATKTIEGDEILSTATAEYKVIVAKKAGSISFAEAAINKKPDDAPFTNKLTVVGDGKVTFASSDANVATVDAEGKVTIKAEGTATITATVEDSKTYKYETNTASFTLTVAPAGIPYMAWDNDQDKLVEKTFTGDYTVVTSKDTDVEWSEGTYVVEGSNVEINGMIKLTSYGVKLIIKDGAKLKVKRINGNSKDLSIYGQSQMPGELVVNCSDNINDAIRSITKLEVHSAKVTATASNNNHGGFCFIGEFNVYGGSVDAECTCSNGYGVWLSSGGKMNIYGGKVKAVGKGSGSTSYGIAASSSTPVKVYGGTLRAESADKKALNSGITLTTEAGYDGSIMYSTNGWGWSESPNADAKYVKVEKSQGGGS